MSPHGYTTARREAARSLADARKRRNPDDRPWKDLDRAQQTEAQVTARLLAQGHTTAAVVHAEAWALLNERRAHAIRFVFARATQGKANQ